MFPQKDAAYRNRYIFPRSCRYLEHAARVPFSIAEKCNAAGFLWSRASSDLHWLYRELVEQWKRDAPSYIEWRGYSAENTDWGPEKRDRQRIKLDSFKRTACGPHVMKRVEDAKRP